MGVELLFAYFFKREREASNGGERFGCVLRSVLQQLRGCKGRKWIVFGPKDPFIILRVCF